MLCTLDEIRSTFESYICISVGVKTIGLDKMMCIESCLVHQTSIMFIILETDLPLHVMFIFIGLFCSFSLTCCSCKHTVERGRY